MKRMFFILMLLLAASLALAACQPAAEEPAAAEFKVCQVTDVGGIDDKSFNATAWKGVEDAVTALGIEGKYLESQQQTDYEVNINAFVEEGCDLIVPVGFLLADAVAAAAEANPEVPFAIVDVNWLSFDNLYGSGFQIDQATFLAGYLAAGMTETGIVGTYGGINIPPVTQFMDGFVLGVELYNATHGTAVTVLGWDIDAQDGLFVGNFESTDDGRTMGESLLDEGADIIMPVAGPVGAGTLAVLEERGAGLLIGVDNDWSADFAYPNKADYILASALKNMDLFVTNSIEMALNGTFAGGNLLGTLENGYVGLAYGSVWADKIPAELQAEIEALIPQIIAGEIATLPSAPAEDAGLPDLDGREVTIAIENAYLPFNYIDPETGEGAGWDYEVWNAICELLNCTPVYVEAAWEGMIQAVADGQFDAAADGITITADRAEIVDFSMGYVAIEQRLLVRIDEDRIESIEDIVNDEELKLGTQTGTTNYETASQFLSEERISAFEQFPFAVQALIAGDIDAVIMDETAGQGYLGENADVLKLVGPSLSSDELGFIYPKGSDLVEPVDAAIMELMQNGTLVAVNAKFFGPDFDVTYDDLFPPEEEEAMAFLACQVTDVGGIDDKSFNATAWKGVQDAIDSLGIEGKYLESQQQTDYEVNINAFLEEGCDLIVSVGFLLGDATAAAAGANPDQMFAIVDVNYLESPNLYGSGFAINEATFLAGYLAAGMTQTGTVATFGGINIPPVTIFMDGFVLGVEAYNAAHGTEVNVLGWDVAAQDGLFVGNFESTDDGRTMGESLMDEGADIIMPVAGPVGAGTLAVIEERGAGWIVGVDNDWTVSFENQADFVLASALKNMDLYVYQTIEAAMNGEFAGGNYLGTLENGGVGLGYGGVEIPADLQAEIEALIPQIIDGTIATLP